MKFYLPGRQYSGTLKRYVYGFSILVILVGCSFYSPNVPSTTQSIIKPTGSTVQVDTPKPPDAFEPTATVLNSLPTLPTSTPCSSSPISRVGRLAYISNVFNGIVIRDLNSSNAPTEPITKGWSADPAFSPDGSRLAFVQGSNPDEGYNIYVMVVASKRVITVTSGKHVWDSPGWSPDGKKLVFRSLPDVSDSPATQGRGYGTPGIMIMNADGSDLVDLISLAHPAGTFDNIENPTWAPEGDAIMFAGDMYSQYGPTGMYKLLIDEWYDIGDMALDSMMGRYFTTTAVYFPRNYHSPVWSHDGTKLAFVSDFRGEPDLYIFNMYAPPVSIIQITHNLFAWDPAWSPDDKYIAFSAGNKVYVTCTDGTMQEPLFIDNGDDPSWAP